MPDHAQTESSIATLFNKLELTSKPSVLGALLKIGRKIANGFSDGEITLGVKKGGICFIRWSQTDTGDVLKEELAVTE